MIQSMLRRGHLGGALPLTCMLVACGGEQTRNLDPASLAMTSETAPFYEDGELTLYQTQSSVEIPVKRPGDDVNLGGPVGPFSHTPWVTADDVQVQVTWTLANLDKEPHQVEILIDPWNEFGRYVPGIVMQGDEALPNLSGIDETYDLPALGSDRSSRLIHTFSFEDMKELAIDFATVINILETVTVEPMGDAPEEDPRVGLVNHAFNRQNRSGSSPLTDAYIPAVVPGLLGFDFAIRTREPVNVAVEYLVEVIDANGEKVVVRGSNDPTLEAPNRTYTLPGG